MFTIPSTDCCIFAQTLYDALVPQMRLEVGGRLRESYFQSVMEMRKLVETQRTLADSVRKM